MFNLLDEVDELFYHPGERRRGVGKVERNFDIPQASSEIGLERFEDEFGGAALGDQRIQVEVDNE